MSVTVSAVIDVVKVSVRSSSGIASSVSASGAEILVEHGLEGLDARELAEVAEGESLAAAPPVKRSTVIANPPTTTITWYAPSAAAPRKSTAAPSRSGPAPSLLSTTLS